jgi:hypothetical protein
VFWNYLRVWSFPLLQLVCFLWLRCLFRVIDLRIELLCVHLSFSGERSRGEGSLSPDLRGGSLMGGCYDPSRAAPRGSWRSEGVHQGAGVISGSACRRRSVIDSRIEFAGRTPQLLRRTITRRGFFEPGPQRSVSHGGMLRSQQSCTSGELEE